MLSMRMMNTAESFINIQKGVHKQRQLVRCNLHELFVAFKERNRDVKIVFSKFCILSPKWCIIAGSSGTHSGYVCTTHQNTIFLVEELSDINPDFQFHYSQWETTDRASLVTATSTCEEYKDTLISTINVITKHLFSAKCQANFLRAKKESMKANEVIVFEDLTENYPFLVQDETQNYNWSKEYCTLHPFVVYFIDGDGNIHHNSLCFISDDKNHGTNFVYKI